MANECDDVITCLVVEKLHAKRFKSHFAETGILNKDFRLTTLDNDSIAIPCNTSVQNAETLLKQFINSDDVITYRIENLHAEKLQKTKVKSLHKELKQFIIKHLSLGNNGNTEKLQCDIPSKWEKHGDLILFPDTSFKDNYWTFQTKEFWLKIAQIMEAKRLAIKFRIQQNGYRTPNVVMLLGNDPIVRHIDNGIVYEYDVTELMFSKGNITEKLRIASFDCSQEVVVDLFAGIGYFVLPYIMKANAKKVYACEWNPAAVKMLKRNLDLNGVANKCEVMYGDNREVAPKGVADRVNLGLIPTSKGSWKTACKCLNQHRGGVLHIHENIESKPETEFSISEKTNENTGLLCSCENGRCLIERIYKGSLNQYKRSTWCKFVKTLQRELLEYFEEHKYEVSVEHIEYLKSYAPHVDNLVFDVRCRPIK